MNVLGIFMGNSRPLGGCETYRVTQPLYYLNKNAGWGVSWLWSGDLFDLYTSRGIDALLTEIDKFDLIVFSRFFTPENDDKSQDDLSVIVAVMRTMGKRVVYEVDDDYTNDHRNVVKGDALSFAKMADAITVTTPYLADLMSQKTKRPTYVLPNCVDPILWRDNDAPERVPEMAGKILIGLTGSITHYEDWKVLAPIMRGILDENPNVHLLLGGFHPDYLMALPNTTYVPALTYSRYSQIIRGCDIILCPVVPTDRFNLGKSPIKAVEGQSAHRLLPNGKSAGAAVIATKNEIYSLAVKHEKSGLLVDHNPESWRNAILKLIASGELRQELQVKGFNSAYQKYDAAKTWPKWASAYQRILSTPSNSLSLLSA